MRSLLVAILIVGVTIVAGRWAAPAPVGATGGDPRTTIVPTVAAETPTPSPQPTATPLAHGVAQRVNFGVDMYGSNLTAHGSSTFVLWAREGQTFRIARAEGMMARLTAPGGIDVGLIDGGVTLPATGDYLLTVSGVDQISVDIR